MTSVVTAPELRLRKPWRESAESDCTPVPTLSMICWTAHRTRTRRRIPTQLPPAQKTARRVLDSPHARQAIEYHQLRRPYPATTATTAHRRAWQTHWGRFAAQPRDSYS